MYLSEGFSLALNLGARLDLHAARSSRLLLAGAPAAWRSDLEVQYEEEKEHAVAQADWAVLLDGRQSPVPTPFTEQIGDLACADSLQRAAAATNIFERWSTWHFNLLGRRAKQVGFRHLSEVLLHIASQESRHTLLGVALLSGIGHPGPVAIVELAEQMEAIQAADRQVMEEIPRALGFRATTAGWCRRAARDLVLDLGL